MSVDQDAVWLITGCSTGFGRELAREVLSRGWRVAVTARNTSQIADLVKSYEDRTMALPLDVADETQRESAIRAIEARFGRIDVLVNNAGLGYFASVEESDLDDCRALFEVNFFATAALIQRVLPGMRDRRRGAIINIGSIAGLAPFPALGFYAASKHAVEGLTHVLRQEVATLGIDVMCVEPGGFRTEFSNRPLNGKHTEIADYAQTTGRVMNNALSGKRDQQGDPMRGARAIVDAVTCGAPPRHLLLGAQCYNAVSRVTTELVTEMELWREASLAADFPTSKLPPIAVDQPK